MLGIAKLRYRMQGLLVLHHENGAYIEKRKEVEYEKLKSLRDAGTISREEFKKRKAEMFR